LTARFVARGLRKSYGGRVVVDDVTIEVEAGVVHGLLGPNGAGKSTVFRMIAGVERPDRGAVELDGASLLGLPLHARARRGVAWLPQEDTLFRELTARQNVQLAVEVTGGGGSADELLRRVGLGDRASDPVPGLSGGERRRLQIARLLALRPQLLLLDEPFAGVDPVAVAGLAALIRGVAADGVAVLVTDHAVRETLSLCDRATVVDQGVVQVEGTPAEVAADPRARSRYLGEHFRL
jgi:lipopolysaccharide export system ATP-binding protein